ncbi:MAG: hypothetical protein ABW092_10845 [Candidatus Thiodiazotropha sp.]
MSTIDIESLPKDDDTTVNVLINQLYIAVDLYKHEDSLNWSKVSHLLYMTGGLGALLSFLVKNKVDFIDTQTDPIFLVCIFGILTSFGFLIAIGSGLIYMSNKKKVVRELDRMLDSYGGVAILGVTDDINNSNNAISKKHSPTVLILLAFPLGITIIWAYILLSII